jgi:hypothetical protein
MPVAPTSRSVQTDGNVATNFTVKEIVVFCVRLPDVPVMVKVAVPAVATLLATSVSVLVVPVAGLGVKVAETLLGRPETERVTLPLKPYSGLTVMVLPAELPCAMVRVLGEAERVKLGAPFTVSASVAVLVRFPAVPVMVTDEVPMVAVLLAESVSVLVVVTGFQLNKEVTPAGRPEILKLALLLKPFCGVRVSVVVLLAP